MEKFAGPIELTDAQLMAVAGGGPGQIVVTNGPSEAEIDLPDAIESSVGARTAAIGPDRDFPT
jgi:hypothetical protein